MRNIALLLLALAVVGTVMISDPPQKVVFLDIGQGDSILLQDGTSQVLVDGGPGATVLERLAEEMPMLDKKIELLVLSHPQQDHMEGFLHILERYDVQMVLLPKASNTSNLQEEWIKKLEEKNIPYRFAWRGQKISVGDINMHILGPLDSETSRAAIKKDVNNASVMMRVDLGEFSTLLTGDGERAVEHQLVTQTDPQLLDVNVLKAGHHGSKTSTTPGLITAASPGAVVISVGEKNRFGHPHPTILARLESIPTFRTDTEGSIRFIEKGGKWHLECSGKKNLLYGAKLCTNGATYGN